MYGICKIKKLYFHIVLSSELFLTQTQSKEKKKYNTDYVFNYSV